LHSEHGSNASSFNARSFTSTYRPGMEENGFNFYGAMSAGFGTLAGSAHGGAVGNIVRKLTEIEDPTDEEALKKWINYQLANRDREGKPKERGVMGFGHRVYKHSDPRATIIKGELDDISQRRQMPEWYPKLLALYNAMEPRMKRGVIVNVDYFTSAIYNMIGFPERLFLPLFATGRVAGMATNIGEQLSQNILIRPGVEYVGPTDKIYVPMNRR